MHGTTRFIIQYIVINGFAKRHLKVYNSVCFLAGCPESGKSGGLSLWTDKTKLSSITFICYYKEVEETVNQMASSGAIQ